MGTNDTKTSGYAFVDDFRIQTIDYAEFSNSSSVTNSTTFNMNDNSDLFTVANSDLIELKMKMLIKHTL